MRCASFYIQNVEFSQSYKVEIENLGLKKGIISKGSQPHLSLTSLHTCY